MSVSIIMTVFNKGDVLPYVMDSIFDQGFADLEVVVVDDGSTDNSREILLGYDVVYRYLDRPGWANPAMAKNIGYSIAKNDIFIIQSAEVVHGTPGVIEKLAKVKDGQAFIASCHNVVSHADRRVKAVYSNATNKKKPFFFLGSIRKEAVLGIGGDSEDFIGPGHEDAWFAYCLEFGRGIDFYYFDDCVGHHLEHPRDHDKAGVRATHDVYHEKVRAAQAFEIPYFNYGIKYRDYAKDQPDQVIMPIVN
tara:strand:- start:32699 stop:33445 length:747 start_codon:yes stop_codon:yes gene_type:complete